MHHELLSAGARALALLQHPPMHTCPHTWLQRWYSFFEYRQDLKLPLVFRAQVGSEATDPIFCADNAFPVRQICDGAACSAMLDVLSVAPLRELCREGGCWGGSRARVPLETTGSSRPCHLLNTCTKIGFVITFSERTRAKSARMSAPQWEWCLTYVQHILESATHVP